VTYSDVAITNEGGDNTAPTAPTSLTSNVASVATGNVEFNWDASSDNVAVADYVLFQNGRAVAFPEVTSSALSDIDLSVQNKFAVVARDIAGNLSVLSQTVTVEAQILDTDGDGVSDDNDAFPNDPSEWVDTDNDGIGNNADDDDDGDGVIDRDDDFPLDPSESLDTDDDGTGNNADPDDDNDGLTDSEEVGLGTNPLVRDSDGDGWSDKEEIDEGTDPLAASSQPEVQAGLPVWLLYMATQ
jgi:hypothetical protein